MQFNDLENMCRNSPESFADGLRRVLQHATEAAEFRNSGLLPAISRAYYTDTYAANQGRFVDPQVLQSNQACCPPDGLVVRQSGLGPTLVPGVTIVPPGGGI
jgi:hypothetical protein